MIPLTRDEWLKRCTDYMMRAGSDGPLARGEAEAWLEQNPDDIRDNPENVADDIMDYWPTD
jgi:hypothetical protein